MQFGDAAGGGWRSTDDDGWGHDRKRQDDRLMRERDKVPALSILVYKAYSCICLTACHVMYVSLLQSLEAPGGCIQPVLPPIGCSHSKVWANTMMAILHHQGMYKVQVVRPGGK